MMFNLTLQTKFRNGLNYSDRFWSDSIIISYTTSCMPFNDLTTYAKAASICQLNPSPQTTGFFFGMVSILYDVFFQTCKIIHNLLINVIIVIIITNQSKVQFNSKLAKKFIVFE